MDRKNALKNREGIENLIRRQNGLSIIIYSIYKKVQWIWVAGHFKSIADHFIFTSYLSQHTFFTNTRQWHTSDSFKFPKIPIAIILNKWFETFPPKCEEFECYFFLFHFSNKNKIIKQHFTYFFIKKFNIS